MDTTELKSAVEGVVTTLQELFTKFPELAHQCRGFISDLLDVLSYFDFSDLGFRCYVTSAVLLIMGGFACRWLSRAIESMEELVPGDDTMDDGFVIISRDVVRLASSAIDLVHEEVSEFNTKYLCIPSITITDYDEELLERNEVLQLVSTPQQVALEKDDSVFREVETFITGVIERAQISMEESSEENAETCSIDDIKDASETEIYLEDSKERDLLPVQLEDTMGVIQNIMTKPEGLIPCRYLLSWPADSLDESDDEVCLEDIQLLIDETQEPESVNVASTNEEANDSQKEETEQVYDPVVAAHIIADEVHECVSSEEEVGSQIEVAVRQAFEEELENNTEDNREIIENMAERGLSMDVSESEIPDENGACTYSCDDIEHITEVQDDDIATSNDDTKKTEIIETVDNTEAKFANDDEEEENSSKFPTQVDDEENGPEYPAVSIAEEEELVNFIHDISPKDKSREEVTEVVRDLLEDAKYFFEYHGKHNPYFSNRSDCSQERKTATTKPVMEKFVLGDDPKVEGTAASTNVIGDELKEGGPAASTNVFGDEPKVEGPAASTNVIYGKPKVEENTSNDNTPKITKNIETVDNTEAKFVNDAYDEETSSKFPTQFDDEFPVVEDKGPEYPAVSIEGEEELVNFIHDISPKDKSREEVTEVVRDLLEDAKYFFEYHDKHNPYFSNRSDCSQERMAATTKPVTEKLVLGDEPKVEGKAASTNVIGDEPKVEETVALTNVIGDEPNVEGKAASTNVIGDEPKVGGTVASTNAIVDEIKNNDVQVSTTQSSTEPMSDMDKTSSSPALKKTTSRRSAQRRRRRIRKIQSSGQSNKRANC